MRTRTIITGSVALVLGVLGLAACSTSGSAPSTHHTATSSAAAIAAAALAGAKQDCTDNGGTWGTIAGSAACNYPSNYANNNAAPSPSPTVVPVTQVKFVVSGYAPADPACGGGCNPTIDYGSDSSTHNVQEPISGTVTFTVPFDPNAQYYSVNVSTDTTDSHLTCKIVASGPSPDVPTTVSTGSETGQSICSAQAAPSDSTGESWQSEN